MRQILHCDLNNFYASVECANDPTLLGKAVAVCGDPDMRHGIVLAKNDIAKADGVKTGDVVWEARLKCPSLVCVAPHMSAYANYAAQVRDIYYRFTDKIESFGMDECWLDVTNSSIFGDGKAIADELRRVVRSETGLSISVGVSFNKIFAKLGSDMKKPDATTVISYENFREKVWPCPVGDMLMIGKSTVKLLQTINILTIGDLAKADPNILRFKLGINGLKMRNYALGLDDSPVSMVNTSREIKSIGQGSTPPNDIRNYFDAHSLIMYLSEMVGMRLRRHALVGICVQIALRYDDLSGIIRQSTLPQPTCFANDIYYGAVKLLHDNWNPRLDPPLRTITVALSRLSPSENGIQLSLFREREVNEKIDNTLDFIRNKYGFGKIIRGNMLLDKNSYTGYNEQLLPFRNEGVGIDISSIEP